MDPRKTSPRWTSQELTKVATVAQLAAKRKRRGSVEEEEEEEKEEEEKEEGAAVLYSERGPSTGGLGKQNRNQHPNRQRVHAQQAKSRDPKPRGLEE